MPRAGKTLPITDSEFGGGPGLIDPTSRADRNIGQAAGPLVQGVAEELWEIYATNPNDPTADPATSDLTYQPRPKPTEWPNPATAKGTTQ